MVPSSQVPLLLPSSSVPPGTGNALQLPGGPQQQQQQRPLMSAPGQAVRAVMPHQQLSAAQLAGQPPRQPLVLVSRPAMPGFPMVPSQAVPMLARPAAPTQQQLMQQQIERARAAGIRLPVTQATDGRPIMSFADMFTPQEQAAARREGHNVMVSRAQRRVQRIAGRAAVDSTGERLCRAVTSQFGACCRQGWQQRVNESRPA